MDGDGVEEDGYCATELSGAAGDEKRRSLPFVEEAVKWRVFHETLTEVRERFADLPPDEIQAIIDEACASVWAERLPAEFPFCPPKPL